METSTAVLIIFVLLVLVWMAMGSPSFSVTARFGTENMVNEAQWLEVPRGFNVPNGGVGYKPIKTLWDIEQTAHVDQVRLDPTIVI